MSQSSFIKVGRCLEWYTQLPSNAALYSPVFKFQGSEWRLTIVHDFLYGDYFVIGLDELKSDTPFQPVTITTYPRCISRHGIFWLPGRETTLTEKTGVIWENLVRHSPRELDGMKFLFLFDSDVELKCMTDTKAVLAAPLVQSAPQASDKPCLKALFEDLGKLLDASNIKQSGDYESKRSVSKGEESNRDVSNQDEPNRDVSNQDEPNHDVSNQEEPNQKIDLGSRLRDSKRMFRSGLVKCGIDHMYVRDMYADVFQDFERYLYTFWVPELSEDKAKKLYEAGDRYDVVSLMRKCASILAQKLTPDNACDILDLVDTHNDLEFKERIIDYILKEKIPLKDEIWKPFSERCPALAVVVANRFIKLQKSG